MKINFEKLLLRCLYVMTFDMVINLTIENTPFLRTLNCIVTHSAPTTCKTTKKKENGRSRKEPSGNIFKRVQFSPISVCDAKIFGENKKNFFFQFLEQSAEKKLSRNKIVSFFISFVKYRHLSLENFDLSLNVFYGITFCFIL